MAATEFLNTNLVLLYLLACIAGLTTCQSTQNEADQNMDLTGQYEHTGEKLKIGVVGLVHTHVHWILGREDLGDIEIVGIVEPNIELAEKYSKQHGYSMNIVYDSIGKMLDEKKPDAVTAFNTIYGHLDVVRQCAPRGIHVMVEKPLAVNFDHARQMIDLAQEHRIHLLTNYETSWYGSNYEAQRLISSNNLGDIQKINFYTGHPGPIEIGCNSEFLEWLTDPILNGGGALTDFGCYGANLATWLLNGEEPVTVSCVTRQMKPDKYPKVDDDATIILSYPNTQVVIQASWNWSHNRKEMTVYGKSGFIHCKNGTEMIVLENEDDGEVEIKAKNLPMGKHDPFAILQKVVLENYDLPKWDPSSIENNELVMKILEAAKISANSKRSITWAELYD